MPERRWLILIPLVLLPILATSACRRDRGDDGDDGSGGVGTAALPTSGTAGATAPVEATPTPAPTLGLYGPGTTTGGIRSGGMERTFRVHIPETVDPGEPAPLVLMFHGGFGSGEQLQLRSSRMDAVAEEEGFITVYPDGSGGIPTWNAGGCCGGSVLRNVDDIGFVRDLVAHLRANLNIDASRIYAAGMSNGAGLSHRIACELADVFAAVGPVEGTLMTDSCNPSRPIAIVMIHGTDDLNVPWEGGAGCGPSAFVFKGVPETVDFWAQNNACEGPETEFYAEGDGVCKVRGGCAEDADVALCTIEGGDHSWPGGRRSLVSLGDCRGPGRQSTTFSADRALWEFFAAHPMPGD